MGNSSIEGKYINVGTSPDAMKAAIAAFVALGGSDNVSRTVVLEDMKKVQPQAISMSDAKSISWSATAWFAINHRWQLVGDLSDLRTEPEFTVYKIRLNNTHIAEIHEEETRVGCEAIPNDKILEVADRIRKNREGQQQ